MSCSMRDYTDKYVSSLVASPCGQLRASIYAYFIDSMFGILVAVLSSSFTSSDRKKAGTMVFTGQQ
eukprot:6187754-Pleurochrysis_carterae.AAC.1